MNISLLMLLGVFLVIAFRKIGGIPVKIWHAMTAGALLVLVTGQISPIGAMQAINLDVMVFLFGMFVVGEALSLSGYLSSLAYGFLHRVKSADGLVFAASKVMPIFLSRKDPKLGTMANTPIEPVIAVSRAIIVSAGAAI